ncbi:hypothetical protein [Trabulsiella guamensis]|nr:hypothetical protein [Trabulsiella guamensis]
MMNFYLNLNKVPQEFAMQLAPPVKWGRRVAVFCLWVIWFVSFYIGGNYARSIWFHYVKPVKTEVVEQPVVPDAALSSQKYVFRKNPLPAPEIVNEADDNIPEAEQEIPATEYTDEESDDGNAVPVDDDLRQRVREALGNIP